MMADNNEVEDEFFPDGKEYPYGLSGAQNRARLARQAKAIKNLKEKVVIHTRSEKSHIHPAISVTVNGMNFKSLAATAKHFGVDRKELSKLLKSGTSPKDAISSLVRDFNSKKTANRTITVLGVDYPTAKAACRHFGITRKTVDSRLKKGMSIDDAYSKLKISGQGGKKITIYGKVYPSIKAAAEFFDINPHTLHNRLARGMSPEDAVCEQANANYCINGHYFKNHAEIAEFYEIPINRFKEKFIENNGDCELALQATRDSLFKIENDYYSSIPAACRSYGVDRKVFDKRVNKGMSYEDALLYDQRKYREEDRAANPRMVRESIQPIVRGMQFNSVTSLIKYFRFASDNLSLSAIERLRNGGDPEQCIMAQVLILADRLKLIDPDTLQYFDANKIPEGSIFKKI